MPAPSAILSCCPTCPPNGTRHRLAAVPHPAILSFCWSNGSSTEQHARPSRHLFVLSHLPAERDASSLNGRSASRHAVLLLVQWELKRTACSPFPPSTAAEWDASSPGYPLVILLSDGPTKGKTSLGQTSRAGPVQLGMSSVAGKSTYKRRRETCER